jgi:hypothetical protein
MTMFESIAGICLHRRERMLVLVRRRQAVSSRSTIPEPVRLIAYLLILHLACDLTVSNWFLVSCQ